MISHQHKCIFIHIPKTAGQSIEHIFLDLLDLKWETRAPLLLRFNDRPELGPPSLAHLKARDYVRCRYLSQELFDEYFKFTFVRNPWDRAVSIYKYFGFNTRFEFKFYLENVLKKGLWKDKSWFVCPQSDFVCGEDGKIQVNFVGRFEKLQEDFYQVCQRIGLPPIAVPRIHESSISRPGLSLRPRRMAEYVRYLLKGRHIPVFKKYQDYYDDESRELVADLYKKDLELFQYRFDAN
jgi:Sulfotransferase family